VKLQPGTFQKYRFFLYLYVGDGSKTPFVYTFEVHVAVSTSSSVIKTYPRSNQREKVHICTYLHSGMCIIQFHYYQHEVHTICIA
jgi:hypothetical protein